MKGFEERERRMERRWRTLEYKGMRGKEERGEGGRNEERVNKKREMRLEPSSTHSFSHPLPGLFF